MEVVIYGLYDPRVTPISWRYVGKTENFKNRLQSHSQPCSLQGRTHKNNWIRFLLREGVKPRGKILERIPDDGNWEEAERKWIMIFRLMGYPLTNLTDGGDGATGEAIRGERNPMKRPEVARRSARSLRGVPKTKDHRAALKRAWTPERRLLASINCPMKRPEVAAKISRLQMGHEVSVETREKLRRANLGLKKGPQSPEHIRKRVVSWKRTMARKKVALR